MKPTVKSVTKLVILSITAILLLFLIFPYSVNIPRFNTNTGNENGDQNNIDMNGRDADLEGPDDVAVMFGWIKPIVRYTPTPTRFSPPATPTPGYDKKIYHIGYVTRNKIQYYIFKDNYGETTVTLALGYPEKGWTLVSVTDTSFVLRKDSKRFYVKRN
ncbi:MAG: hypothetical protein JW969_01975 [Spirochaetales bacterium]|nr:hypothetical protein [Spirochaetales bacterium]